MLCAVCKGLRSAFEKRVQIQHKLYANDWEGEEEGLADVWCTNIFERESLQRKNGFTVI
jgi:hypothetical protein